MAKKYYWLKLKNDFFKRHDMRIIESMPNGKDYVLFYLKLLVESVSHEGDLRFSDTVPYNEGMLATITNTNIDVVRTAIKVFTDLELMEILDDGTIYMNEVSKMVGEETEWAKKKRIYRENKKMLELKEGQEKTLSDKSLEKELEKEIYKDIKENGSKDDSSKVKTFEPESDIYRLTKLLSEKMIANDENAKVPVLESDKFWKWCVHIDRLIRLDKRDSQTIANVIK